MQIASLPSSCASRAERGASRAAASRAILLVGVAAAVAAAMAVGQPDTIVRADPELARLLRGMSLIKAVIVLAAIVAVVWRLGGSVSSRATAAYVAGAVLMAGSSMLIWQLTFIAAAAAAFHVGAFAVLISAWRDDGVGGRLARPRIANNPGRPSAQP